VAGLEVERGVKSSGLALHTGAIAIISIAYQCSYDITCKEIGRYLRTMSFIGTAKSQDPRPPCELLGGVSCSTARG
jgi:hypothetical protein